MKNRLQFNRHFPIFSGGTITTGTGEQKWIDGREQAKVWLENKIKRADFIPLIGEPIVLRYLDKEGKKQLILAVGKATGNTIADTTQREYHIIDSAELTEGVNSANEKADVAVELASAATKDTADYLTILKNMIMSGIGLTDGTYFDNNGRWDRNPSQVGLYDPIENANYISGATSFRDADDKLDKAVKKNTDNIENLSGVVEDTIVSLNELWDATGALSAATVEFSANTVNELEKVKSNIDEISATTESFSAGTSSLLDSIIEGTGLNNGERGSYAGHDETHIINSATSLDNADVILDMAVWTLSGMANELSANTVTTFDKFNDSLGELSAATIAIDEKVDGLSANTMAADQVLEGEIEALANKKVLGVSAITVNVLENGDSKVSLLINEEDDKVLTQNALGLKANVSLVYSREDKKIYLKGKNDITISSIDADDFIKDGMLSAASIFVATEADHEQYSELVVGKTYIKLLFNVDAEEPGRANPVFISAEDLVDIYTIDPDSHAFMEINDYVIKLNVDKENGLASYDYARNISAVTANIISATGLNMGEQGSYPGHAENHYIKNAGSLDQADVLLDEAVWNNNQGLAELSATTESFSSATNTLIENILAGTGLNTQKPGEYQGHDDTHYISKATSLDNADVFLDESLWVVSGMVVGFDERIDGLEKDVTSVDDRLTLLSATTAIKIAELSGRTVDLDKVYEYIDSGDTALKEQLNEVEEVVAASLNDLNSRVGTIETHFSGEYIPLTGYELASGVSEDELIITEEDTISGAFGKIQKQLLDNEEAIAGGLNSLNKKVIENAEAIAQNTGVTVLSATVQSFSSATYDIFNSFGGAITSINQDIDDLSAATESLSGSVMSISAKTSGLLTLKLNGVEQGKYCPSASTTINLEAIQEVTGKDVLLTGYGLATGTTEEELVIVATDTVNEAFGKLQKQFYDNESVTAGVLNDLNDKVTDLSGDVTSLSTDVANNRANIQTLSGDMTDFFDGAEYVSSAHTIIFKHGEVTKGSIDASDFIKDGMVSSVTVKDGNLVISFNTDAGHEDITLPLSQIFNPDNYYNKTEINALSGVVANNVTNISNVSGTAANNLSKINGLSSTVANNTSNITNVSGSVADSLSKINSLSGVVASNVTNINNVSGSVADNLKKINNLSSTVANNTSNISNLSGAVTSISNKVSNLSSVVVNSAITSTSASTSFSANTSLNAQTALSATTAKKLDLKYTTSNALTNLNFAEFLTIATIGGNATLSIASTGLPTLPANGVAQRHVIIENTGSSEAIVTIANDSRIKITPSNSFNQFAIGAGERGELNVLLTYNGSTYTIYVITT